jgi:hypothetical protein
MQCFRLQVTTGNVANAYPGRKSTWADDLTSVLVSLEPSRSMFRPEKGRFRKSSKHGTVDHSADNLTPAVSQAHCGERQVPQLIRGIM